jgi:flagellar basal-body rod protein FlgC
MVSASVSGMRVGITMFDVAAHDIANASTPGFEPSRVDAVAAPGRSGAVVRAIQRSDAPPPTGLSGVQLADELPELIVAGHVSAANASALRAHDETLGHLLDVLA